MELLKDLELVEVAYENENKKAVMTFLDEERGEVRTINFNRQSYDNGAYIDDPDKAAKVDSWCDEMFGLKFDQLSKAIGTKKNVYVYDGFNSLFEVEQIAKFGKDMKGQILNTTIKDIVIDSYFIRIRFEYEGKTYESKMTFGKYMEDLKKWFVDPVKKEKEFTKFKEKFGVDVEDKDTLIGTQIFVEVKEAFNKFIWNDIKPLSKK